MPFLNYHHLRYFRTIAREQHLTRAAAKLNISAPALSIQLRQLEQSLGHTLFERGRAGLTLTEAGRLALEYAETIFRTGEELQAVLQHKPRGGRQVVRIGAVSTLSRNFQLEFLGRLINRADVELVLRAGTFRDLLMQLQNHTVDVVLSTHPAPRDAELPWHSHLVAEQPASFVGGAFWRRRKFKFPQDLRDVPVLLPSADSNIRVAFDRVMDAAGLRPLIAAEVEDMAMLRLLAREQTEALTLVPTVVVRDELESGLLTEKHRLPEIRETFYAVTPTRRFPNQLVRELVEKQRPRR
jgi:LysR family transcriptional activator of nhaA